MRISEVEQSGPHAHGTIALLKPRKLHAKSIKAWCQENNLPCIPEHDLHCTVLYSRKPVPHLEALNGKEITATGRVKGWKKLGTALVLELESPKATAMHRYMREQGGSHDFPSFIAHTTVCYEWDNNDLPKVLPRDFVIEFDSLVVKAIDPNYIEKIA
jgi:hypothetical protein